MEWGELGREGKSEGEVVGVGVGVLGGGVEVVGGLEGGVGEDLPLTILMIHLQHIPLHLHYLLPTLHKSLQNPTQTTPPLPHTVIHRPHPLIILLPQEFSHLFPFTQSPVYRNEQVFENQYVLRRFAG